ncbi:uncharacterized protein K460DRAFT_352789 [Cucurbitaria berberidis CBS 394.84]|uniref:Uncharacterized protein n=1 Tax=Cucurbitaria berberidis CBS 394.84 TaxID=1168544 RepID=A0A9P4GLU4_9PLEO|nr:uncharacterized protein K460DRAFT_352789 [Cucurbitaria berberidis CBS 394.84]KAF1847696.1 hypothetical protein K460DRAFT_352789 [Cucurbitaria berberidis CBS 394.84]
MPRDLGDDTARLEGAEGSVEHRTWAEVMETPTGTYRFFSDVVIIYRSSLRLLAILIYRCPSGNSLGFVSLRVCIPSLQSYSENARGVGVARRGSLASSVVGVELVLESPHENGLLARSVLPDVGWVLASQRVENCVVISDRTSREADIVIVSIVEEDDPPLAIRLQVGTETWFSRVILSLSSVSFAKPWSCTRSSVECWLTKELLSLRSRNEDRFLGVFGDPPEADRGEVGIAHIFGV